MAEPKPVRKKHTNSTSQPCLYTLHIELRPNEIRPPIWRRLEVDGRISLAKLHHFIQAAFGWSDYHLHQFKIRDKLYALPDPGDELDMLDERKAYLNRLLATGDSMLYRYDLGDNWEHLVTVEEIRNDLDNDPKGGAWVLMAHALVLRKMSAARRVMPIFWKSCRRNRILKKLPICSNGQTAISTLRDLTGDWPTQRSCVSCLTVGAANNAGFTLYQKRQTALKLKKPTWSMRVSKPLISARGTSI